MSTGVRELALGRARVRLAIRSLAYGITVTVLIVVVATLTFTIGQVAIAPLDLPAAVTGNGSRIDSYLVTVLLGPRLVTGICAGALLGVSGTLVQTLTRNPLGSPDIIGISAGAGAGAAAAAMFGGGLIPTPLGAVIGAGLAVCALIVATRGKLSSPNRIIIAGIGISAFGIAFTYFALTAFTQQDAAALAAYIVGSLEAKDWITVLSVVAGVVVLAPIAIALSRRLSLIELGDEFAEALGVGVARTRTLALLAAIACAAVAVGAVGPIAFVALSAPQIAKRIARSSGASVVISALTGAAIIALGDLVVQQLPVTLPVGVLTAFIGAVYLGFVLAGEWKKGTVG